MKEILSYLIALEKFKNEPATLEKTKEKFPDKDVEQILSKLLQEGIIFEPRSGIYRWLG